ncbi:Ig-like domain-containing protein [Candidatus Palauibacter sp.]|uniref:Ig-like domain-containing protein n=1 Tax=Candidatus Palauibacter sp. TaxID=3101350 RepID=UPI003B590DFC
MSRPRSRSGARASLIALAAVAVWLGACGTETTSPEPDRNRSPLVVDAIPATDVPIGQLANVDVAPYFRDPDGDELTFTAVSGDPLVARVSVSGSAVTLEGRSRGTVEVAVTANDGDGLSATQRFEVTAGAALTLALGVAQAIEGVDARLEVVLAEAAAAPLTLSYTLGLDASHLTDDAEAADYFANGSVEVPAGASGTTIAITIVDDDEIEPPIEVFTVSLDRPDNETGYVLASPSSAVVVIREGVCDRTPQVRDGIVESLRVDLCSDPDQQDLARLKALPLKWDEDGDGVEDDEVITELNEDDFRNLPGLEWLSLQGNRLTELPENIFSDLSSLEVVDLSDNELTELPPGLFAGLRRLGWISLFDNRLAELPPTLFQGLTALRELYLGDNELTSLPPGVFSRLFRLETLGLAGNRVAFAFEVRLARGDGEDSTAPGSAELEVRMLEGAPFTMMLPLSARGGTLSVDSILLRAGSTASARVRLTPDDGSDAPISVTIGTGDALSDICVDRCDGFDIVAGDPLVVANPESVALSVPTAYVTQATQSREGEVPLVAGRRSLLRVFATADEVNSFRAAARATFFRGEAETHRVALEPPTGGIPLEVDESRLGRSFNAIIPGHVLEPGLSLVVEMDPDGTVPLTSESQPRFPAQGRYDLGVRDVPPLHMTLVPVQYHTEANRDVNPGVADFAAELVAAASGAGSALARSVLRYTRTVLPIGDLSLALREPYFTWADTTEAGVAGLLGEIELLRTMEAKDDNEYYSGIFGVPAPRSRHPDAFWIDGLGLLRGRTTLTASHGADGRLQKAGRLELVFAHELGHNLGRPHTPCDDPLTDPGRVDDDYPWANGTIGMWGHDFGDEEGLGLGHLFDPEGYKDLMSYCYPQWISDYSFTEMFEFRLARASRVATGAVPPARAARPEAVLLLWGGVRDDGLRLEPTFVHTARPKLPETPGPYRLAGMDAEGRNLFSLRFAPDEVDGRGRTFTFAIPFDPAWVAALDRVTLSGPEGFTAVDRSRGGRGALIVDRATGRVRSVARDWSGRLPPPLATEDAALDIIRGLPRHPG